MLSSAHFGRDAVPMALPLEELLPWHEFGSVVDVTHMRHLEGQLRCLEQAAPTMRAHMAQYWRRFLWSSMYGSYLGEDVKHGDAFEGVMAVLHTRIEHEYRPASGVRARLRRHVHQFPCREGYCRNGTELGPCY